MSASFSKITQHISELHENWNLLADDTVFLRKPFLSSLQKSCPDNITIYYVEFFEESNLIGIALFQHINLRNIKPFQLLESTTKSRISSWALNTFASSILFVGNNMISGQNAFRFKPNIKYARICNLLNEAVESLKLQLKKQKNAVHVTVWKDFTTSESENLVNCIDKKYFKFTTQPTMIFNIPTSINSESNYVESLSKKYRDQYKRARKKASGIEKRQLSVEEIEKYKSRLFQLYSTTVSNASFNTFYLPQNHFAALKEEMGDLFQLYAYFLDDNLIGFNTIIKNGKTLEPYFLGYDAEQQKSQLLYLNMLYDIIGYASAKKFQSVAFGRTALEIKSSVGAKPVELFGFIKHSNPVLNRYIARIFMLLEPKIEWKVRNPFKADLSGPQA